MASAKDKTSTSPPSQSDGWTCTASAAAEPLENLTVGSLYNIQCKGAYVEHSRQGLAILLDEESQYKLHLIEVLSDSPTELTATVTSYKPGKLEELKFKFTDGNGATWTAVGVPVEIKSVIDPQKGPPQPYGPMGPIMASLDWWYYALLVSIGVIALGLLLRRTFKIIRRKNFYVANEIDPEQAWARALGFKSRKGLLDNSKDRHHYFEFNRFARELLKTLPADESVDQADIARFCVELKKGLDQFITQTMWIPANAITVGRLLGEIKRQDRRFYQKYAAEIKRVKSEVDRAAKEPEKMSVYDCQQLVQMTRKLAGLVYNYKRKAGDVA